MSNKFLKYYAIIGLLLITAGAVILYRLLPDIPTPVVKEDTSTEWYAPDIYSLPSTPEAELIRYGKKLIENTARYLGPRGSLAVISNGMNCQNCHLDAGTRPEGNSFAAVAATYPKFRERSGRVESIEFRVNECMERSLNGKKLDSISREMRAMVAYLKWVGKDVAKGNKPKGAGIAELAVLSRAADSSNGRYVFVAKCQSCHGADGQGVVNNDSSGYIYPPLWGPHSYNISAGIYRLSRLAGYVKYNMPFTATTANPQLSDEEAWDVSAYINSQQRPQKFFTYDWPKTETKPFDYPFSPFADSFSVRQHKYGPFEIIKKAKAKKAAF